MRDYKLRNVLNIDNQSKETQTMNKTDLIKYVKETANLKSLESASKAVDAIFDTIQTALAKGEDIALTGFGSFSVVARKAREGRNPRTGQAIKIAASKQVKFKAGKTLKDAVA
ncbi:MAG: HU family DNA-binding protein [Alphaproteobacteria bacterium]|nr:HU family DNA-binding protein [Alphaproteobacteria bacterium]